MEQIVKINNPNSPCRVVNLRPGQILALTLDNIYGQYLNIQSEYLEISSTKSQDCTFYKIKQTKKAILVNKYSTFYLGEISTLKGNLLLYLEADNPKNKNTITVVNPGYDTVKLKANQILEVVCYNRFFYTYEDQWFWEWIPAIENLDIDQLGFQSVLSNYCVSVDSNFRVMPRITNDLHICRQHHFWFRFDKSIISLLTNDLIGKSKYAGKFIIRGFEDNTAEECIESIIEIYLDGRSKYLKECKETLNIPEFIDYDSRLVNFTYFNPLKFEVKFKRKNSQLEDNCKSISNYKEAVLSV